MIRDTLDGRSILLTGVTGFLGKVLAVLLLEEVPGMRLSVLVRPRRRTQTAQQRFEELADTSPAFRRLRAHHGADLGRFLGARLRVLSGDIEKPRFGLDRDTLDALRGDVDAIVHCAGLTDFMPDPTRALAVNVAGAKHAADLASYFDAPLVHVSTAYVAGNVSGHIGESLTRGVSPTGESFSAAEEIRALQVVCRATPGKADRIELGEARALALGWPNTYCYSKALAEHLLAARPDVSLTIVRPAIVECAREFPFAGWNEGLNTAGPLAWLISTAFRRLPTRGEHPFDIVPVDEVARGLVLTLAAVFRGEAPAVVHLASSDANPFTFERAVELTGLGFRRWTRKGGGTPTDQWLRWLDPVPVAEDAPGPFAVPRLRSWVRSMKKAAHRFDPETHLPNVIAEVFGDAIRDQAEVARDRLDDAHLQLGRIEKMLELFKPFIHDNRYVFDTTNVRSWSDALHPDDAAFAWTVPELCWRTYWVDVEYPGLATWCLPVLRGEDVPRDSASNPPLRLESPMSATRELAGK
ncbi:MAG: thioester reductase-like protein [Myxococcota bacterium]|jgi:thioester reductase-like protein